MEIKHIYWFSYFNLDEPSVRYRAKFPLQQLKEIHGITYNIVYLGYDFQNLSNFVLTFFSVLFFRKKNSIIVFQKIFTSGIYTTALKAFLYFQAAEYSIRYWWCWIHTTPATGNAPLYEKLFRMCGRQQSHYGVF